MATGVQSDVKHFIQTHLPLLPVPGLPHIRLHKAVPSSRLGRFADVDAFGTPYWAYHWGGGLALARYLSDYPERVAGGRVLDLGSGSGLVAITAALAGAASVTAAEVNAYGVAALELNAAANGVAVTPIHGDLTAGAPPDVELILVGDLFYEEALADRVTLFLDRCVAAGIDVLIGDPWRAFLPHPRLKLLTEYEVAETGDTTRKSAIFEFGPSPER